MGKLRTTSGAGFAVAAWYLLAFAAVIGGIVCGFVFGKEVVVTGTYYQTAKAVFSLKIAIVYWLAGLIGCILFATHGMILSNQDALASNQREIMAKLEEIQKHIPE